jgi:hypothetical protein
MNPKALALMGAASFYGGPEASGHHKRYSGQQEIAPNSSTPLRVTDEIPKMKFEIPNALRFQ